MGKNHKRQLAAFIKGELPQKAAQFDKDTKRWVKTDIKEDLGKGGIPLKEVRKISMLE